MSPTSRHGCRNGRRVSAWLLWLCLPGCWPPALALPAAAESLELSAVLDAAELLDLSAVFAASREPATPESESKVDGIWTASTGLLQKNVLTSAATASAKNSRTSKGTPSTVGTLSRPGAPAGLPAGSLRLGSPPCPSEPPRATPLLTRVRSPAIAPAKASKSWNSRTRAEPSGVTVWMLNTSRSAHCRKAPKNAQPRRRLFVDPHPGREALTLSPALKMSVRRLSSTRISSMSTQVGNSSPFGALSASPSNHRQARETRVCERPNSSASPRVPYA